MCKYILYIYICNNKNYTYIYVYIYMHIHTYVCMCGGLELRAYRPAECNRGLSFERKPPHPQNLTVQQRFATLWSEST